MKRLRRGISFYGWVIIRIFPFPLVKISYKDCSENENKGPFIFVCNHKSSSDPFLMACLPYECVQVVNVWPFKIPVLGRFAKLASYLSVKEMPFEEFSQKAVKLLKEGVSIITFPEGTRAGSKPVGQFNSSIFRVALQSRYPIVPICISGNENIPARGTMILKPGTVKMKKLPAVEWEKYKDYSPFKLKEIIRNIIANEVGIMEKQ